MPPLVITILSAMEALMAEAPQVIELGKKAKDFFTSLVGAEIITKKQQKALHDRVDKITEAIRDGYEPPSWKVEPDPE